MFTETDYGLQPVTPEQQSLAKQVVDQLATNPLFKNDASGKYFDKNNKCEAQNCCKASLQSAAFILIT
ncbi:hypothetical protein [Acidithiobacillus sulfurivorans]|uniref:Uncharacterized protein n=1 Tax=Acidithiobacillus sulfurivorans TaxID=1958756 RepID=A0ABS6A476_9PROT|nr:hypothetical protein [Acidithiobacillus sulfurivorans]MBU2761568.1 hypothetical protein [Acidithiobacillus sulfurivorans]